MHKTILRYIFCNGSIYLFGWMILRMLEIAPNPVEPYIWNIPIYPLILLPMIFINVLYLSGFLGDAARKLDEME